MTTDKLYEHLHATYHFEMALRDAPGTSIIDDERRAADGWFPMWRIGEHVYVRVHPAAIQRFEAALAQQPIAASLTVADLQAAHADAQISAQREFYYLLKPEQFQAYAPNAPYQARQLQPSDQAAFAAFLAQCSADDRDAGDVSIDPKIGIAYGVLDGARIVACASTYDYDGFTDVGILTDPAYRWQGVGKAAVSALSQHFLTRDDVLLLYRHESENVGSRGIVRSLNYELIAHVDFVRFQT